MVNGGPLFTGNSEETQLDTIFKQLGTPDETTYPGISELPDWRSDFEIYPAPESLKALVPQLEPAGLELLQVFFSCFLLLLSSCGQFCKPFSEAHTLNLSSGNAAV